MASAARSSCSSSPSIPLAVVPPAPGAKTRTNRPFAGGDRKTGHVTTGGGTLGIWLGGTLSGSLGGTLDGTLGGSLGGSLGCTLVGMLGGSLGGTLGG